MGTRERALVIFAPKSLTTRHLCQLYVHFGTYFCWTQGNLPRVSGASKPAADCLVEYPLRGRKRPLQRRSTSRTRISSAAEKRKALELARAVLRLFNHLHLDSMTYRKFAAEFAIPEQTFTFSPPSANPTPPNSCNSAARSAPDRRQTHVPDAHRTWRSELRFAPSRTAYRDARPLRRLRQA